MIHAKRFHRPYRAGDCRCSRQNMLRYLIKDSAIYAVGTLAGQIIGFVMMPVYTRVLTPADYGVVETVMRIVDVINLFLAMGMVEAFLRHYYLANDEKERYRLISSVFSFNLLIVVLGCIAAFFFAPYLSTIAFGHQRYARYVLFWLFAMLMNNLMELPLALWRAEKKPWRFTGISVGRLSTQLATNIVLVVWLRWGVWGVVMSTFLNSLFWSAALALAVRTRYGVLIDLGWMRSIWRYGLPLVPASVSQFLLHYSDRFFLARYATETELGLYSLAYRFGMLVSLAMRVVLTAWYPWVFSAAQGDPVESIVQIRRAGAVILLALSVIASGVILFMEPVLRVMSAPQFWQASQYIPVLALATWFFAAHIPWSAGARLASQTHGVAKAHVFTAALCLAGYALSIPRYTAWGAAWVTLFAFMLLSLSCLWWSERALRVGQDVRSILLSLLLMTGASAVHLVLHTREHSGIIVRLVAWGIAVAVSLSYINSSLSNRAVSRWCASALQRWRHRVTAG